MLSLICESTIVLFIYLCLRRLFIHKVSRRTVYALGTLPAALLLVMLFWKTNVDFWIWIATNVTKLSELFTNRIALIVGKEQVFYRDYSTQIINLFNSDDLSLRRIWLAGIIMVLCYRGVAYVTFIVKVNKGSNIVEDETYQGIAIRESFSAPAPFLLWNNVFIPKGFKDDDEKYHYAMMHEYGHFAQGDPLWNLCRVCMTTVFWFHPLMWIACFISKKDSEFACDEVVTATLNQQEKNDYCVMILSVGTGIKFKAPGKIEVSGLTGNDVGERVKEIKNGKKGYKKKAGIALVLSVLLLFLGSIVLIKNWQQSRSKEMYGDVVEIPKSK